MNNRHIYLKVKIKSLAEEAKIIRKEENKAKASFRWLRNKQGKEQEYEDQFFLYHSLRAHRKEPVGTEARAALIAYGFIRGKKYKQIEDIKNPSKHLITKRYYDAKREWNFIGFTNKVFTLINKYGKGVTAEDFIKWLEE